MDEAGGQWQVEAMQAAISGPHWLHQAADDVAAAAAEALPMFAIAQLSTWLMKNCALAQASAAHWATPVKLNEGGFELVSICSKMQVTASMQLLTVVHCPQSPGQLVQVS